MKTLLKYLGLVIFILFFSGYSLSSQSVIHKSGLVSPELRLKGSSCVPHNNFEELVAHLESDKGGWVHVTHVNPPKQGKDIYNPTHYYTSFAKGEVNYDRASCTLYIPHLLTTFFSDRDNFKGKTDKVSLRFFVDSNSVEITFHSWGNAKHTLRNIKRHGQLMFYVLQPDGSMTIFNFYKTGGVILR